MLQIGVTEEWLEKFDDVMSEDINFNDDFITLDDFEKVFDEQKFPAPPVSYLPVYYHLLNK